MNLKRIAGYFLASSRLTRIMETTRYVVVDAKSLLKKAKDANTCHKNNEKRLKRERAKVLGLRRRQLKVKMERVEKLEKEVSHLRLDKVLDEVESGVYNGKMTGKRRIKTNSPDSQRRSTLEALMVHNQKLKNELQSKIELVTSLINNASDPNLFKDRLQEKSELWQLKEDVKGLTRENAKLKHVNDSLSAQKCTLKGHGFNCMDSTLENLVASSLVPVAGKKRVRATPGEKKRKAMELRDISDPTEVKTEGTDGEVNESVEPVTEIVPNNVVRNKVSSKEGARNGCDTCGKSYKRKDTLKRHMKIHSTESPVKCNICDKICLRKDTLKRHLLGHSMGVSFECDVCGRKFKRKDALKEHKKGTRKAGRCIPPSVGELNQKSVKEENIESKEYWIRKVAEL